MRMKAVLYEHVVFTILNLVINAIEVGLDYVVDLAVDPIKNKTKINLTVLKKKKQQFNKEENQTLWWTLF